MAGFSKLEQESCAYMIVARNADGLSLISRHFAAFKYKKNIIDNA